MTSKSSRKSIVANFGLLSAELENRLSTDSSASRNNRQHPHVWALASSVRHIGQSTTSNRNATG